MPDYGCAQFQRTTWPSVLTLIHLFQQIVGTGTFLAKMSILKEENWGSDMVNQAGCVKATRYERNEFNQTEGHRKWSTAGVHSNNIPICFQCCCKKGNFDPWLQIITSVNQSLHILRQHLPHLCQCVILNFPVSDVKLRCLTLPFLSLHAVDAYRCSAGVQSSFRPAFAEEDGVPSSTK